MKLKISQGSKNDHLRMLKAEKIAALAKAEEILDPKQRKLAKVKINLEYQKSKIQCHTNLY